MELKDIVLKKGDIVYFADNSWYILTQCENNESIKKTILPYITDNKIIKIERPVKYKTIYEAPKEILDKEEKQYLEAVIRPFKQQVKGITRQLYIDDDFGGLTIMLLKEKDWIWLPLLSKELLYKGMELDKEYTLEELGLFE